MKSTIAFNCIYCHQNNMFTTDFVLSIATDETVGINCRLCQTEARYKIDEVTYFFKDAIEEKEK